MSSTKPASSDPSEIAGRYQVVQKLGAGAFGTVYKAKDKLLGRMVAIKTIRLEGLAAAGSSLEELLERFTREAQVSAQLKHPNIVTIYDIGNYDGLTYLAMEFIDGVGLDRLIANEGGLGVERAASIGAQVADALDFAHKNNVVHRDIKPANIMIEAGDRVKVTDFGIAKVTNSGEHLTMTGSLLGTPSYMSPEQARGSELDGRSDLFAAGCVLYEMLAGKKAFRGDSITGLIFKIITEEPPSLREFDPAFPDEILRIIAKAMSKAPETRYQSGRELTDDLIALVRPGSSPTIRQTEMGTAAGAAPPAAPTMVSSPTVGGAAPTKLVPPPTPPAPPRPGARPAAPAARPAAGPPPRPEAARKSGGGAGLIIGLVLAAGFVVLLGAGGVWWFFLRDRGPKVVDVPPSTLMPPDTQPPVSQPPGSLEQPPDTTPATQPPATQPPVTLASQRPPDTLPPPVTQPPGGRNTKSPTANPPARDDYAFLDEEQPEMDGSEAGQRVAGSFRNNQGGPGSTLGTGRTLNARPRSPRNLSPNERPAVAVLRHVINAEAAYQKRNGRYGSLVDLKKAGLLPLDVPVEAGGFDRRNYGFSLKVEDDGFTVVAMPKAMGGRPFHGTDSGFIMEGVD